VEGQKLDHERAFQFYVSQGIHRSLRVVAREFKVNKRTIQKVSKRNQWQPRLREIERIAREQATKEMIRDMSEVSERHLKLARAIQSRGAQALQKLEFDSAWHGAKAIEMAAKLERLVLGEATERTAPSVAEATRREVETLLTTDENEDGEAE